ncbi:ABC transporter ATP-binding protein [Philodulcilactobacillus myokoensis]|uniref:ABC transporter ATP-binding protein n=1 Tax=Philodulcilactobacillus myokoensis TaxID=2929573 RepID=A0A9W6AYS0_9LACO|nr:ABC transporter ATP-binding protein [Philodulcilactobacillus myokoensis]GLB46047.1 ABC transporter ATP-binding protein [Philodulcilactobacillus myokoensis]
MLTINHISKAFRNVQALSNVSFNVQPGKITGLIGQNGAGKSTTFHSILNFINYDGEIKLNQQPITEQTFDKIGYLPEERSLMPKLTVEQQIIYFARLKDQSAKATRPKIKRWMQKFDVKGDLKTKIKSLSKGNQQKVQLICTLIHEPSLIILDEPFSGLDPVNADLLKQHIINAKQRGAMIIFSSHNMNNVEELCDNLVMLKNGHVVLNGTTDSVRDQFGKNKIYVTTQQSSAELSNLPHVMNVKTLEPHRYLLMLDDPSAGPDLFDRITHGKYVEEFSQQPPTLDEIFRMEVRDSNA